MGKATGYCRGKGGSMHISDLDLGMLGANGIVGAGTPIAVGAALGFRMRGEDRVAVPFVGDAATNTGNFPEGLNMASIWKWVSEIRLRGSDRLERELSPHSMVQLGDGKLFLAGESDSDARWVALDGATGEVLAVGSEPGRRALGLCA